uniref:Uncharacterized protein n=1 Tax=Cucumis melo TaxID=3656 RepID=A0A9I9D5D4_CUCME
MRAAATVPRRGRKEAGIERGEESDEKDEENRCGEENPVDVILGSFNGGLVGEPPGSAEENGDDGEEEEDGVGGRIEGKRIED